MAALILTADTSVVVPALAEWHPLHKQAFEAVRDVRRLPAHVLFETVSVLTRMRGGVASPVGEVVRVLTNDFPGEPFVLDGEGAVRFLDTLGATAATAGATLLTADRRALPTYAAVGVKVDLLS